MKKDNTPINIHKIENVKGFFGYIPFRLEGSDPKVNCLSQNILFGKHGMLDNGQLVLATALYLPDRESYHLEEGPNEDFTASATYYNRFDHRAKVILKYTKKDGVGRYNATKYFEDKELGSSDGGDNWELFFTHVAFLKFAPGEKVEYTKVKNEDK